MRDFLVLELSGIVIEEVTFTGGRRIVGHNDRDDTELIYVDLRFVSMYSETMIRV